MVNNPYFLHKQPISKQLYYGMYIANKRRGEIFKVTLGLGSMIGGRGNSWQWQAQNPRERKGLSYIPKIASGCCYCQLACSFIKAGRFGWADSRITVRRLEGKERYQLGFAPDCDGCGYCAKYCFFGVLGENKAEVKGQ